MNNDIQVLYMYLYPIFYMLYKLCIRNEVHYMDIKYM